MTRGLHLAEDVTHILDGQRGHTTHRRRHEGCVLRPACRVARLPRLVRDEMLVLWALSHGHSAPSAPRVGCAACSGHSLGSVPAMLRACLRVYTIGARSGENKVGA